MRDPNGNPILGYQCQPKGYVYQFVELTDIGGEATLKEVVITASAPVYIINLTN